MKEIPGILIGHAQDTKAGTGCTVLLTMDGAVCGVDQRGGAPATRETDAIRPMRIVERVHAVLLAGGSSFGLSAAHGVMKWLEERGVGFDVGVARVPLVPAAALFDLKVGRADIRPTPEMGYSACLAAKKDFTASSGSIGAGTGAAVGCVLGPDGRMKGGIGAVVEEIRPGILVGVVIAVNCFGDVVDPDSGKILAGARKMPEGNFVDTLSVMPVQSVGFEDMTQNTVIGVVATNAVLSKDAANKVAQMSHNGLARSIRPAHTMFDGDTIFALATCKGPAADLNLIGAYAAELTAKAVVRAVSQATTLHGVKALRDL